MTTHNPCTDEKSLRKAFAQYPCGLAALAAQVDGADHVLLVATFSVGISLAPPLVSFAVQRGSSTWPLLRQAPRIGVSVLSADQGELSRQLANKDKAARWIGVGLDRSASGAIFLSQASLTFDCAVHAQYPAGDHEMVLLEVASFDTREARDPVVFHGSRFRCLEAA